MTVPTPLDLLIDAARRYTSARGAAPIGDWHRRIEDAGWKLAEATRAYDKSTSSTAMAPEKWEGLEPPTVPVKREMDQHVVLDLYRREDGGLQIAGRDNARGLILSGPLPAMVLDKVWPALFALKNPITIHDYGN